MKVITKLLNYIVVILVVMGIIYSVSLIKGYFEPHIDYNGQIDSLNREIALKEAKINLINDSLFAAKQTTNEYKDKWQKAKQNLANLKAENQNQDKVKDLPLDEMLRYILDYYGVDSSEARIVESNDTIVVIINPQIVDKVGNTIAELKDKNELIEVYENNTLLSDSLIRSQDIQIELLESKTVTLETVISDYKLKDAANMGLIDAKNAEIKKYKLQRNVAGGVAIVILVLALF
jgi:hypothetical protein